MDQEYTSLKAYEGPVVSVLMSTDDEILRDLVSTVEATMDRAFRLTKGGLPPKPLWGALNDRLLWKDPPSILDDWDEVDQIRFIYALAMELNVIQTDLDRNISVGVGADRFFFASPTRRAAMLMRGWIQIEEWDERCDARNEYGHRYHFGQTYRRDFAIVAPELRLEILAALENEPADVWFHADDFAMRLNHQTPSLLVAEGDAPDLPPEDEPDEEFVRFVDYWLYQAARFGWVNLARIKDSEEELGPRVFSLTPLFTRLNNPSGQVFVADDEDAWRKKKPFQPGAKGSIVLDRKEADIADEYLLRRLADPETIPSWDGDEATFLLTPESLERAAASLLNYDNLADRLEGRCTKKIPPSTRTLLTNHLGEPHSTRMVMGITAVEVPGKNSRFVEKLRKARYLVINGTALIPWDRWDEYVRAFGDPQEGFDYPSEEPLAHIHKAAVQLVWPALPMAARDLLEELGLSEDSLDGPLTESIVDGLGPEWTLQAVAEALRVLADDNLPAWLSKTLSED